MLTQAPLPIGVGQQPVSLNQHLRDSSLRSTYCGATNPPQTRVATVCKELRVWVGSFWLLSNGFNSKGGHARAGEWRIRVAAILLIYRVEIGKDMPHALEIT